MLAKFVISIIRVVCKMAKMYVYFVLVSVYYHLCLHCDQEPGNAFVLKRERYAACRGSQSHFRGYPCSLWTLFHAVTVNAEHIERQSKSPIHSTPHLFKITEIVFRKKHEKLHG